MKCLLGVSRSRYVNIEWAQRFELLHTAENVTLLRWRQKRILMNVKQQLILLRSSTGNDAIMETSGAQGSRYSGTYKILLETPTRECCERLPTTPLKNIEETQKFDNSFKELGIALNALQSCNNTSDLDCKNVFTTGETPLRIIGHVVLLYRT